MNAADELGAVRESERQVLFRAQILDTEVVGIESGAKIAPEVEALPGRGFLSDRLHGTDRGQVGGLGETRREQRARHGESREQSRRASHRCLPQKAIVRRDRPWPRHLASDRIVIDYSSETSTLDAIKSPGCGQATGRGDENSNGSCRLPYRCPCPW